MRFVKKIEKSKPFLSSFQTFKHFESNPYWSYSNLIFWCLVISPEGTEKINCCFRGSSGHMT